MKVYDVTIYGGEYEDSWEQHHLFSTLKRAQEFTQAPLAIPSELTSYYDERPFYMMYEVEVDSTLPNTVKIEQGRMTIKVMPDDFFE